MNDMTHQTSNASVASATDGTGAAEAAEQAVAGATAAPTASPAPSRRAATGGTSALVQLGLVLAIALGGFAVYRTYTAPVPAPVYTVNLDALMSAKEIQTESMTDMGALSASMQAFVKGLHDDLAGLSRRGAIVLKSNTVLTDVPSLDLTAGLAKHLGIEVALSEVPAREAARRALYQQRLKEQVLGAAVADPASGTAPAAAASTASRASPATPASGDGLAHLD